ncbi:Demethylmenaquinone methyltransferase [Bienertia sinuspersici]
MASTTINKEIQIERVDKKGDEGDGESDEEAEWIYRGDAEDENRSSLILIGKPWTRKNINAKALMDTMENLWNPRNRMETRRIETNMFSFQFFHWKDKARVLDGQPWHFDQHALCISRGNDSNATMLANKIGTFVKNDKSNELEIDRSLRIRVIIDIRKRPKAQEGKGDREEEGKGRRKIFFTKPEEQKSTIEETFDGVLKKLDVVVLDNSIEVVGGSSLTKSGERQDKVGPGERSNDVEEGTTRSCTEKREKKWHRIERVQKTNTVLELKPVGGKREDRELNEQGLDLMETKAACATMKMGLDASCEVNDSQNDGTVAGPTHRALYGK